MNGTDRTGEEHRPADEVVVALSGGAKEDAREVFGVLRTAYGCDRAADDVPQEVAGDRPTVWIATFDVSDVRAKPRPARLTAPVAATLQGGYAAVESLRASLASAFAVRVVGTASGDQEEELQLRLESRP
ncbi:hypothetical protein [Streptomyces corynorhini]|uniref:Uncharacterized protein n=1 Tax=Streptomyces corynorhini TaxID=2282652 RepID=A0A370B3A4_9ACTN|nr:hypothetical protein [Streptomyces corynorhini]RDG35152.1 hypothetical protein DVH02_26885 [Streptomyces corynorhini]